MDERSEPDLIARILGGERQLFHDLVRPYERAVYVAAYAILRDHADAEEAAQETMLKVLLHLGQLEHREKFNSWLLQIAVNEARLQRRRKHASLYEPLDPAEPNEPFTPRDFADWRELPSEAAERSEVRAAIARALDDLPDLYREVFVLRDVQQIGTQDAARILGISVPAVKVRLHRARLMMREKLAPAFRRRWFDWISVFKGKKPW